MTTPAGPAPWTPGDTILAEFRVERSLGAGGFGRVDLVRSLRTGEQYAVKRMHAADPETQRRLLIEAQRWIELPAHPHVTECRFVRTSDRELAVFIEFVPDGSLAGRIASGALFEPGDVPPAERIVRLAAQIAWGLDAAHSAGLLHLDMKPDNVLLAPDGTAKVTDFGLASSAVRSDEAIAQQEAILRYIVGDPDVDAATKDSLTEALRSQIFGAKPDQTIEARAEGGTQGYQSPEQAEGGAVGRGADVWSWGLTVLAMFAGGRRVSGTLAAPALERLLARGPKVAIPPAVADLLRRCFDDDPAARPHSMREIAETLTGAPGPAGHGAAPGRADFYERSLASGAHWDDPRRWLQYAFELAGRDTAEAIRFWPTGGRSARSMALGDLAAYAEAARVLEELAAEDRPEAGKALARVRTMTAMVRRHLGDIEACLDDYREAARIDAAIDDDEARRHSIVVFNGLSIALRESGDAAGAVAAAERSVALAAALPDGPSAALARGTALLTRGNAEPDIERRLSNYRAAVAAVAASDQEDDEVRVQVVKALAAQASALSEAGRPDEAGPLWQRIDATLDAAIADGHRGLRLTKAVTLHNRGLLAATSAQRLAMAEAAATILRELVENEGQYQLAADLAAAQFSAAYENELLGRPRTAHENYRAARRAYEQAVLRDGRTDLADRLARAYDFESTLTGPDAPDGPIRLAEQAVAVWTRLAETDGRARWQGLLSDATRKLSAAQRNAGDLTGARDTAERALALVDGSTGEVTARDNFPRLLAEVELAAVERAAGEPMAAVQRLQDALARADRLPDSREVRPTILLRLGHALGDLQSFEAAVDAYDKAAQAAEGSPDRRTRLVGTLEAQHGRINALMRFGEVDLVVDAATTLLERYAGLIAEGRDDLAGEQARLRGLLGHVLFLAGDLPAAVTTLEAAGAELTARPGDMARLAGETLTRKAADTRALLEIGDEQVPAFLADLRDRYEQRRRLSLAGDVVSAAYLLEEDMATALAVAERHFSPDLVEFCGELGIGVGLMSAYAHRDATAIRSFDIAARCYLGLYDNVDPRPDHLDRWCDAQIGQATVYAVHGDQDEIDALLENVTTTVSSRDPHGSPARVARVRQAVEQMASKYGRTG